MAAEYGLNQTIQAEVGEFNYLYINDVEVNLDTINSRLDALETVGFNHFDPATVYARLSALEGNQFDSSIVDNLSTSVQGLQTRISTVEGLVASLTNNNTSDTAIEHRLTNLEKIIIALKAMHEAKKAVYNIPLDW